MPDSLQTNKSISLAERRILNGCFYDQKLIEKVSHEDFVHGVASSLMKAMERMKSEGTTFTRGALLQKAADIDLDVDTDLMEAVFDDTTPGEPIDDAIKTLKKGKKRIDTIRELKKTIELIDQAPIDDEDAEAKIRDNIDEALEAFAWVDEDVQRVYDMPEWMEKYEGEREKRKKGKQYPFNNFVFDELIPDGAFPGTFGCLAASSGSGKSTIALKLMRSLISTNVPCMMFSLEMALIPTADRMLASELQIPYSAMTNPGDPVEFESISKKILAVREELDSHKKFRICESADLSLKDIERHVRKFQSEIGQRYCVVIIDLLSMVKEFSQSKGGMNYADSVTTAVNSLSSLVKTLGIHVVGVVQLNRSSESEKAKTWDDLVKFKPQRSQIKSSNGYLERSRYILGAYRPLFWAISQGLPEIEYQDKLDICEISVLKVNNGETGKVIECVFDGEVFDVIPITVDSAQDN
jgi:replicative DNA helicase